MADDEAIALSCNESLQISSPPKLTRLVNLDSPMKIQTAESVKDSSSLPALAGEVALAQKNQILRLENRKQFLQKVKDEHREALRLKVLAEREMQAIARKSNLLQNDIESTHTDCESLEKEIDFLVRRGEQLKRDIECVETGHAKEKCTYEEYEGKMNEHKKLVEMVEKYSEVDKKITSTAKDIELLKNEKEQSCKETDLRTLLSGEMKEILAAELLTLNETKSEMEDYLRRDLQIHDEEEKQKKLRRDIELLQKKYQAQLTWTRKQLQETMTRNKQWSDEAALKEREIQEMRRKIEQS